MTLIPLNGHVQIEPLKHEEFIASSKQTYEEIGIVVALPPLPNGAIPLTIGDKVYFDSWLAAKYPNGNDGYYWLVPYENIRAYEQMAKE